MNQKGLVAVWGIILSASLLFGAVEKSPYLLFEGKNTQMTVMWQLTNSTSCTIEWGTSTAYEMGSKTTSEYGSDHQHRHTITGLAPNTIYYYNVSGVGKGSFRTAPESSAKRTKFIAYGDTRTYPEDHNSVAKQIVSRIKSDKSMQTAVLFSGDYVSKGYKESDWTSQFFPLSKTGVKELHTLMPNIGCIGNHEGTDGSSILRKYYPFPHVKGHYWTFEYGPAQVYIIDQYTQSYSTGSSQYNWLQSELASCTKEWKIVVFHAPGYSAGGGHSNNTKVQNYLQPLFEDYGVDFVINGDNHYYSRAEVNGVTHITTGGGGAPLYSPNGYAQYIKKADKSNHFCELDLNANVATVTVRRASGSVIETFSVEHEGPQYEITMSTPAGGESYPSGAEVPIIWTDNIEEAVAIDLMKSGSAVATIAASTASDGEYNWTIPASTEAGSYSIKVSSATDPMISDVSGSFTIEEAVDTTKPVDLMPIAGWAMTGDDDGSTFSIDTTQKNEGIVGGQLALIKADDALKIYPWAKVSAWFAPGNLDSIKAIKIAYTANSEFQIILEDSLLSKAGTSYQYVLPQSSSLKEVLLTPSMFSQPSWLKPEDEIPLSLKDVDGISFGSTKSEASVEFELRMVTVYNMVNQPPVSILSSFEGEKRNLEMLNEKMVLTVGSNPVDIAIYASNGRTVLHRTITSAGVHRLSLKELNLASGVYFYQVEEATKAVKSGNFILK